MQRQYEPLVNLAVELGAAPASERDAIEARYAEALHAFVDDLLGSDLSRERALAAVDTDLTEIAALSDAEMHPILDKVRYDLVNRIEDQVGPSFWQSPAATRLIGIGGVLLVVLVVAGYFGLRAYNAVTLGAAIETRAGIEQRANALAKVLRHGAPGTVSTRPTGVIRNLLNWPFEATEPELAAAFELANVIFYGASELGRRHEACNLPVGGGETVSDQEIRLLNQVVTHLRAKDTVWKDPPATTILDPIKANYPC